MISKKFYTTLLLAMTISMAGAQDIHYTQFYNTPLTTNPALTGIVQGGYRLTAIYRNQWFSSGGGGFFNSPYQTPSLSFDMPVHIKNGDMIGVGAVILYDAAGAGSIKTFSAMASGSYIKHFGSRHQLSAGFQAGFTQTRLANTEAQFASQFQGNEYNNNLSSGVNLLPNVNYLNLNAGLMYCGKLKERINVYAGGAVFNTSVPKYNLVANQTRQTLSLRGDISAGLDFKLGKRYHILPSGLWMRQSTANQLNTGIGFGYDFSLRTSLTLGVYNRVNDITSADRQVDAAIAYAGLQVRNFKLGASYDFTMSKLRNAGPGTGGFELSLTYIGKMTGIDERLMMFSPRF